MKIKTTSKTRETSVIALEQSKPEEDTQAIATKTTKPKHFRKTAQEEIGKEYTNIVQALAKEAVKGSVQHTKLLFDLGGVKEEVRTAAIAKRRRPPSLGQILLKEAEKLKRNKQIAMQDSEGR